MSHVRAGSQHVRAGSQHAHVASDKRKCWLWYHFDKWLAAHGYMLAEKQLLKWLVKALCRTKDLFPMPADSCCDCLATRCAFQALETYIDFAVNTARHQKLESMQTMLRQTRDKLGLDNVRKR